MSSRFVIAAWVLGAAVAVCAEEPKPERNDAVEVLVAPAAKALDDFVLLEGNEVGPEAQWVAQFKQQFQPMLNAELRFIRYNVEIPVADRPKVRETGVKAVESLVNKMAQAQLRPQPAAQEQDPRARIREALKGALKEVLPPEQFARYETALERRNLIRKRAAIRAFVARLDALMLLSIGQRQQIEDSISKNWQSRWEQWINLSIYGDQYLPLVDEQLVVTHLNDNQKAVWNGIMKVEFGFWQQEQENADDDWWNVGQKKAKPARPVARPGIGFF